MMKKDKRRTIKYRITSFVLTLVFVAEIITNISVDVPREAEAAATLTMEQAISLAKANSDDLEEQSISIAEKQAEYASAVKSIALKKKQNSTIKWSFLLNLTFPTTPDEAEQYDYVYKPLELSQEIAKLNHTYNATSYTITQETYDAFVEIYTLEQKIEFNENQISNKEKDYKKLKAKVATGQVEQGTVDDLKTSIEGLQTTVADDKSSLQTAKERLSQKIGLDVTTKYSFSNPYLETAIPRDELQELIDYALENDDTYYSLRMDATTARVSLQTHWKLVSGHYNSSDVDLIRSYVTTALSDGEVSKKSFKKSYDQFIKAIDSYWVGKRKIFWFISIPKVWSKDETTDGTNWITDDPQALYSDTLEYQSKRKERDAYETTLSNEVTDTYNAYVAARKAYKSAVTAVSDATDEQKKAGVLYKLGEMEFDEYVVYVDAYSSAYTNYLSTLSDYSSAIYLLNKVTCGKALMYLYSKNKTSDNLNGSPYTDEEIDYCMYYIEPIVADEAFEFHVYVPDGFVVKLDQPVKVSNSISWQRIGGLWVPKMTYQTTTEFTPDSYELWIGTTKIGKRTSVDEPIRHLQLDLGDDGQTAFVRLYSGNVALCDCTFDAQTESGKLEVVVEREVKGQEVQLGTYSTTSTDNTFSISIDLAEDYEDKVKYYRIMYSTSGEYLQGEDYIDISKKFTYLSLLNSGLSQLKIELYDENQNLIARGTFDVSDDMRILQDLTE